MLDAITNERMFPDKKNKKIEIEDLLRLFKMNRNKNRNTIRGRVSSHS